MGLIHIDQDRGVDSSSTEGSESHPFQTLSEAYLRFGPNSDYRVMKRDDNEYHAVAKSALKKAARFAESQRKKQAATTKRLDKEADEQTALLAALEQAKSLKITEDAFLPEARLVSLAEIDSKIIGPLRKNSDNSSKGYRIKVQGRVLRVAKQGGITFVTLRRGLDYMQCLIAGQLAKTYDALTLVRETAMEISGELWEVPPGLRAPLDRELHADFFRIIAKAPGGDEAFSNRVPEDGDSSTLLNLRHLALRHEKPSAVMFVRDVLESAFHTAYKELHIKKVSPPALVQTQVEGGATLFAFNYYGEPAYLTQSSQLYLETLLPALGDVYCIEKSFRAEKSLTRRHVSLHIMSPGLNIWRSGD